MLLDDQLLSSLPLYFCQVSKFFYCCRFYVGFSLIHEFKNDNSNIIQLLALSGLGILNLEFETDGNALWIPEESPFLADSNWLKENFDHDKPRRINSLIIEGNANNERNTIYGPYHHCKHWLNPCNYYDILYCRCWAAKKCSYARSTSTYAKSTCLDKSNKSPKCHLW